MTTLFISDLHLDAGKPETIRRFVTFIETEARAASALYILGDLFEAWVGDDEDDLRLAPVQAALAGLTRAGVPCSLMHGNRDFLIGRGSAPRPAASCSATTSASTSTAARAAHARRPAMHRRHALHEPRGTLRNPAWQRDFLAKPLAERRKIAADLRQLSAAEIAAKSYDIMDVNQTTVENVMREHGVSLLLHGHTHRPAIHRFVLDGRPAVRIVLGAWYEHASVVRWNERGYSLDTLD